MEKSDLKTYEYGAMCSKFSLTASNKLTAYATMIYHYDNSAHLLVVYSPEECKLDSWFSFDGKVMDKLDSIFGGKDSFQNYFFENKKEIVECYKTIKRLI